MTIERCQSGGPRTSDRSLRLTRPHSKPNHRNKAVPRRAREELRVRTALTSAAGRPRQGVRDPDQPRATSTTRFTPIPARFLASRPQCCKAFADPHLIAAAAGSLASLPVLPARSPSPLLSLISPQVPPSAPWRCRTSRGRTLPSTLGLHPRTPQLRGCLSP